MSVNISLAAGFQSLASKPSTTSKTAILTGIQGFQYLASNIRVTNSSGGGVTFQAHFYDASKSLECEIYPSTSISTATTTLIDLGPLALDENDELRVTVGTGSALSLVVSFAKRGGGNG